MILGRIMQCLSSVHSGRGSEARTGWEEQKKNTLPGPANITKNMSAVHRAVGEAEGRRHILRQQGKSELYKENLH